MDHATVIATLLATPFAASLLPLTLRLLPGIAQLAHLIVTFRAGPTVATDPGYREELTAGGVI